MQDDLFGKHCSKCKGEGEVKSATKGLDGYDLEDCPQCQGTGYIKEDSGVQIINLLKEAGGRLKQKTLRTMMPISESKLSLILDELQDNGIIRSAKKGRGNVIILNDLKKGTEKIVDKIMKDYLYNRHVIRKKTITGEKIYPEYAVRRALEFAVMLTSDRQKLLEKVK